MCGAIEMDGYVFCLGLDTLGTFSDEFLIPVTNFIRGAIFRSRETLQEHKSLSQDLYSLGELFDMYHIYKATKRHDKLYALLGMCSDDLQTAGLEPNYDLSWGELMRRLIQFILGDNVSLDTWDDREIAFIKTKGYILGQVFQVEGSTEVGGSGVKILFKARTKQPESNLINRPYWTLPKTAISIQKDDIICLFQGASKPTIVRLHNDHFIIIMIAAVPSESIGRDIDFWEAEFSQSLSLTREFSLVWNWELTLEEKLTPREYDELIQTSKWGMSEIGLASQMRNAIRTWSVAQMLEDIGEHYQALKVLQRAVRFYGMTLGQEQSQILELGNFVPLLSWAAGQGHEDVVRLLLDTSKVDIESKDTDGQTPLSWAAVYGHKTIVQLLLEAEVDVKSKDWSRQTPLSLAAANGHEDVVKKLLEAQADIASKNTYYSTPLSLAARNGHEAVVKQLLECQAETESKDWSGQTPLSLAAANGHASIVRMLIEAQADIESRDLEYGQTPLSWAARNGHEAVVEQLLEAQADADCRQKPWSGSGQTPLSMVAENRHQNVVMKSLATGKVNVNSRDNHGNTPLSYAAKNGHESIVKLLLATGKVNVDSWARHNGNTPLLYAVENGHENVVKLLLANRKVNADSKDLSGRTPLFYATKNEHQTIVRQLLATGKVNVNFKDNYSGRTLLSRAAEKGHESIVKLLLASGKVNIDSKDLRGRTPLLHAVKNGHEKVVKLLLATGKLKIDSKDLVKMTPLMFAARNGDESIVKLLLATGKVNIASKDQQDRTPLWYAKDSKCESIIKLLQ
jgi:ankyrin repeat protein